MGWLDKEGQVASKKKYGVTCFYMCNHCKLPIPPGALFRVDPKGGFFPWPKGRPKETRPFTAREPKVTYHIGGECEDMRMGRHKKKYRRKQMLRAAEYMLDKIEGATGVRWTRERCVRRLIKKGYEKSVARKAVRFIRKERLIKKKGGGYVIGTPQVPKGKAQKK